MSLWTLQISDLQETAPVSIVVVTFLLVLGTAYYVTTTISHHRPWPKIPVFSLPDLTPLESWTRHGKEVVAEGTEAHNGHPFQVITGTGPKIVLPNRFAEEVKADPYLSFGKSISMDFFANYPGFEGFKPGRNSLGFLPEIIRVKLTPSLGLITNDMVEETTQGVHAVFGEDTEWHSIFIKQAVLDLVARLSSRVFLGSELCNNPRWLDIAKNYTIDAFVAARTLRAIPFLARPLCVWFLAPCKRLRRHVRDAENLITPEVKRRKERARNALASGQKPPRTADTIGWMYELGKERREALDYVKLQLMLSFAAIHTTSESVTTAILDLLQHPEHIEALREEVIEIIGKEGWSKNSLYKLRLMDSFLKESQRMHPQNMVTMNRFAERSITLSDGTVLPKGARIMTANGFNDAAVYANPERFDAYRFLREREKPDQLNSWQHVSVSPEHMAFGYGQHACPGRFFASTQIKIAMVHLLLKYDWKAIGDDEALFWTFESTTMSKPNCQVQLRRRKEEIDLDLTRGDETTS